MRSCEVVIIWPETIHQRQWAGSEASSQPEDGVVIMAGQPTYSPPVTYLNKGLTRAYSKEIPKQKLWVKSLLGIFQGYVGKILDSWLFFLDSRIPASSRDLVWTYKWGISSGQSFAGKQRDERLPGPSKGCQMVPKGCQITIR